MVHPLLGMQPCGLIPNLNYYPPQSEALRGHKATCQSSDSGSRRLNRSGSNHDELDAPYDMSSKRSFHSFRNNKKAPDGAIYDINDDEEDVEESADMQPMHDNLVNDEKKEYKLDDDIFYFEDDGEDYIVNDVTLCPRSS
eukprot:scaffold3383_cov140-Chaetoceros_neogracile.AAC.2